MSPVNAIKVAIALFFLLLCVAEAPATVQGLDWEPALPPPYEPSDQPVVHYEIRGGPRQEHLTLSISEEGEVTLQMDGQTHRGWSVPNTGHFFDIADAAGFIGLPARYEHARVKNDVYDVLTLREWGRAKTITIAEAGSAARVPPGLLDLVAALRFTISNSWYEKKLGPFPFEPFPSAAYTSPNPIIGYSFEGMGSCRCSLQVRFDGTASIYSDNHRTLSVPLDPAKRDDLWSKVVATAYLQPTPEPAPDPARTPQPIMDVPMPTDVVPSELWLTRNGHTHESLVMFEDGTALGTLAEALHSLLGQLEQIGPSGGISYELLRYMAHDTQGHGWDMSIDTAGGVYLSGLLYRGRLLPAELTELDAIFRDAGWYGLDEKYLPVGSLAPSKQSWAYVCYGVGDEGNCVGAYSGATAPPALDRIYARVAEIHARFQQVDALPVGMPDAGRQSGGAMVVVCVAALAVVGGALLRRRAPSTT